MRSLCCQDDAKQEEAQLAEEMGLAGSSVEDAEVEMIRQLTENQTVTGDGLLARIAPLAVDICLNTTKYKDPILQTAAALSLAKFMMIR